MKKGIVVLLLLSQLVSASDLTPIAPEPSGIIGQYVTGKQGAVRAASGGKTAIGTTTKIFPQIVVGDGWETTLVIVNLSDKRVNFLEQFFDNTGAPMKVAFRTIPEGKLTETSGAVAYLDPHESFNIRLFDAGTPLQQGWSWLVYDETQGRLGAYATFRQRVTGRPDFEALVPLSPYDDWKFYMPFDNLNDFSTAIALVNTAANLSAQISLTFYDVNGVRLLSDMVTLPQSGSGAFAIPDRYPALKGKVGTVYVQSNVNRLSALGLRFNPQGAFSTIPIMNWDGMFR